MRTVKKLLGGIGTIIKIPAIRGNGGYGLPITNHGYNFSAGLRYTALKTAVAIAAGGTILATGAIRITYITKVFGAVFGVATKTVRAPLVE